MQKGGTSWEKEGNQGELEREKEVREVNMSKLSMYEKRHNPLCIINIY